MADSEEESSILHSGYCNHDITIILVLQAAHMDGKVSKINLQYCIKSCTNLLPILPSTILPSSLNMILSHVRKSKTVLDSRFQVLDSECFVSETWILKFQSIVGFWIP